MIDELTLVTTLLASVDQSWGQGHGEDAAARPSKQHVARGEDRGLPKCSNRIILNDDYLNIGQALRMGYTREMICRRCMPDAELEAIKAKAGES